MYIQFSDSIIFISGVHTSSCEELNIILKLLKEFVI